MKKNLTLPSLILAFLPFALFATENPGEAVSSASTFLWIAVVLLMAKISSLVERIGQPSVLGELTIGVLMGNLALLGCTVFEPIKVDPNIAFLAELGVVVLLFQIGLESNLQKMKQVGVRAFMVALVGVTAPFALAYFVGPYILPGLSDNAYLFLGATLTATSVSIPARMFQDLNKLHIPEAQIVLGAAVIDDVEGLIILAVVSAIVTVGAVSFGAITWITAKALLFLIGAIVIGQWLAPHMGKLFSKIQAGPEMKFTSAICFGLVIAFLAKEIELAPIVGAFVAGLVLVPSYFASFKDPLIVSDVKEALTGLPKNDQEKILNAIQPYSDSHVEELIRPIGMFLVPIFFVLTGMNVKLEILFNGPVLLAALGITAIAFIGKILSGLVAGNVNKWIVGVGMIPRGEVGLIFAMMGKSMGVITDEVYSVIIIMVILSTLCTPPLLAYLLRKHDKKNNA